MSDKTIREKNTDRLTVHLSDKPVYDIVITEDFTGLPGEVMKLDVASRKLCIVTDSTVSELYLEEVRELLMPCCRLVTSYVFPAGEAHKNLATVQKLYEKLIKERFDRSDMLVALGGGVVGDLCGFAAATYLRGISFIQIPTTLLSQVDSSIGGKTGVDFDSYKNMVGAFHMPGLVYTNISTLLSLPDCQFAAGMGEVIKHGLIRDRAYYDWLLEHAGEIQAKALSALRETVVGSNLIKREVVETDPTEKGDRMLLNFGHTLGHAVEKLKNFELLHGECVALGSLAAMHLSEIRGMIAKEDINRFREALKTFRIPDHVPGLTPSAVIEASKNDKKMESGVIKFILLESVGCAYVDRTVTDGEMEQALAFILTQEESHE
ncbi:3-dehydroquinate synthase [uncultured Clostridium sp.]|uniref:3-dehydroquinate synthase n=1 Tax=uncultured Clostridium sp. TaxID=59620 RepID=UPI0025D8F737|nr:3-dehydroquinate synthase [uncultured Clostridium sp.]